MDTNLQYNTVHPSRHTVFPTRSVIRDAVERGQDEDVALIAQAYAFLCASFTTRIISSGWYQVLEASLLLQEQVTETSNVVVGGNRLEV